MAVDDDDDEDDGKASADDEEEPAPKTKTPIRLGGQKRAKSEAAFAPRPSEDRNSNMAVGMALNRTFVMRGSKVSHCATVALSRCRCVWAPLTLLCCCCCCW
jgi:hypothetical protein